MLHRFQDPESLVAAIRRQQIVRNDDIVARKLAAVCELVEFGAQPPMNVLITQDAGDNELFLILAGSVSIWVNGRELAVRRAGQHVGEMAMIDLSAARSATVLAIAPTIAARISERAFVPIADAHPSLWRELALELANRLRERGAHIKSPNPRPVIFIGSSRESLAPAREIQSLFSHDDVIPRPWTEGFRPSATTIENLEAELRGADFAVLVLAAEDVLESRGVSHEVPRDNVIWEHGFFVGGLGRDRVFIVMPRGVDLKLPSDWAGITLLNYDGRGSADDLSSRLGAPVNAIRKEIARLRTK